MSNATPLTDSTFKEAVATGVTLVDFWAEWCMPCRMLGPTIDEIAGDYAGKANVAKVNVDEAQRTAQDFGVSSIPTIVVIKDGKEMTRFVGVTPKAKLSSALDAALA